MASEPEALLQVLTNTIDLKRIGLEAGPLSQWLYSVLAEAGLPVICVETRHMRAMLKAQINKTDAILLAFVQVRPHRNVVAVLGNWSSTEKPKGSWV